jgi:hypothetical protein
MSDDIVARLRVLLSKCCTAPAMAVWSRDLREAADEIERLREQLRLANIDNFNTTAKVERLCTELEMWRDGNIMSESHRDEIERLRAERDEARRMFCNAMASNSRLGFTTPRSFAEDEGWDCFKEASDER